MYNCRKCEGSDMFIKEKGTNTGLYCQNCGAWQKWLGKDEIRAFKYKEQNADKGEPKFNKNKPKKNLNNLFDNNNDPFEENSENNETMITIRIPLRLARELMSYFEDLDL